MDLLNNVKIDSFLFFPFLFFGNVNAPPFTVALKNLLSVKGKFLEAR